MELTIIAGIAENNVIGTEGDLPWHISEDLKRFKALTLSHPVIMGRKTFESVFKRLGKPLPERTNIVITRNPNPDFPESVIISSSIEEAINKAKVLDNKAFIIGGQQIYEQTLDLADKLEITKIHKDFKGDAFFPEIKKTDWTEITKEEKETSQETKFSFITYKRRSKEEAKKGIFIAFEGIDGCGKSTQIKKLVQYIFEKNKHHHIILTRNPYKDTNIRTILTQDSDPLTQADKLAELFIEDRKKQVEELVLPNLQRGHFVVTDRYKFSTIAYQSAQGLLMEDLISRQESLPIPQMTFIIDVSPEEAMARMKKDHEEIRGKEHKFEAHLDFIHKLRENYLKVAEIQKQKGEKVFIIDGNRKEDEIFQEIKEIFDREMITF